MKRLLTLILALLMAATLAGGVKSTVLAEEENPYLGLWEMTGGQQGEIYLSRDQMAGSGYLYFLPNGVVYGIVIEGEYISEDYAGYRVTGENALELSKDDFTVCGVYDPETGVLALTDSGESLTVFAERVKADPLPDIWAMADHSDEERTYYGYRMTYSGKTMNMLETLPAAGADPREFYLTLAPDGTGSMQTGQKETAFEITWTDTEIAPVISPEDTLPYTRQDGHILFALEGDAVLEFAPEGEVEVLLAAGKAAGINTLDAAALVGEWRLVKADDNGELLTAEQLKGEGLTMFCFRFNEDGTAAMTTNDTTTPGLGWALDGGKVNLTYSDQTIFSLTYDGTYLVLPFEATLYFEKVG